MRDPTAAARMAQLAFVTDELTGHTRNFTVRSNGHACYGCFLPATMAVQLGLSVRGETTPALALAANCHAEFGARAAALLERLLRSRDVGAQLVARAQVKGGISDADIARAQLDAQCSSSEAKCVRPLSDVVALHLLEHATCRDSLSALIGAPICDRVERDGLDILKPVFVLHRAPLRRGGRVVGYLQDHTLHVRTEYGVIPIRVDAARHDTCEIAAHRGDLRFVLARYGEVTLAAHPKARYELLEYAC